jgi:hypothetical protein
LSQST